MDSKYENLREKSVFNFTDDESVLKTITNGENQEDFLNGLSEFGKAYIYLELANIIGDKELEQATLEEFDYEIRLFRHK